MLILLSQNEQGISAIDLQKHIFPSGSSSMNSTFPWMQRHYVNYYKGEQLYETNRRETASVILLLPLFSYIHDENTITNITSDWIAVGLTYKHLCGTPQEKDDMMFMIEKYRGNL
jgi:hypothetical protein